MLGFLKAQLPPRRVVAWHTAAALPLIAVVVLGGYLSYHYHVLSIESREHADRANEVVDRVNALFLGVMDADLAARTFIITGDEGDLAPVQHALKSTEEGYAPARQLLVGEPRQLIRLSAFEAAIATRLAEIGSLIELRRQQGFEAARRALMHRTDKLSTEQVRRTATDLLEAEHEKLLKRQLTARANERRVLLVGASIAGVSIALRLAIAWALARLRKRGRPSPFAA